MDRDILVAYADGELDADEARRVEAWLRNDPAARACLSQLRETGAMLRGAFATPTETPPPSRAVDLIRTAMRDHGDAPALRGRVPGRRWWPQAIAASLAALAIGVAGYGLGRHHGGGEIRRLEALRAADEKVIEAAVSRALEKQLSGVPIEWTSRESGSRGSITPVRTFRNSDGQWCREYHETVERGGAIETRRAIACREDEGQWRRRAQLLEGS